MAYFSSISKEQRWVDQVSKKFIKEVSIDISDENPICVFNVPLSITIFKPEAYLPQMIALGPYHHMDPNLYHMERYKIACAKSFLNQLTHLGHGNRVNSLRDLLINTLKELDPAVRGCYHNYLDFDDSTLSWIMSIDGLFLANLLQGFFGDQLEPSPDTILSRDLLLLENQIPFVVLMQIYGTIKKNIISSEKGYDYESDLLLLMERFCRANSPLKLSTVTSAASYNGRSSPLHLLDLMYHLMLNNGSPHETQKSPQDEGSIGSSQNESEELEVAEEDINSACDNIGEITKVVMKFGIGAKILKPVQVIQNIPWDKILTILGLKTIKDPYEGPVVEEIKIPSVSSLHYYAGITFRPTSEGIKDIKFVEEEAALYLPSITLDVNSEVIFRNLVAYETAMNYSNSGSFSLSEFVDLMSGIVDKAEDARLLKEKGIIKGVLTNDQVAKLFNGMNKSARSSSNKTVVKINNYYKKRLGVKVFKFIKKRFFSLWKVITRLLTLVLLLLLVLYSFCMFYGCPKLFGGSS